MVERRTALNTSAPAAIARNTSASGKLNVDRPKPVIASPQIATAMSTARPGRRVPVVQPLNVAAIVAPRPEAAAMNPTPAGPTMNTSSARAGYSDRGDPNTMALMSIRNVVSTSRRRLAKRRPSTIDDRLGGPPRAPAGWA